MKTLISPLHVGILLRSALRGTLSGSLSVTLTDESWKSPLIEDKKYNQYVRWRHIKKIVLLKCSCISGNFDHKVCTGLKPIDFFFLNLMIRK